MGKTLDELKLTDAPIHPAKPQDLRNAEWYRFSREIDDLLASGEYGWASDTLTMIQQSVEQHEHVTEGQRRAVQNIEHARTRRSNRRYEGFRR